MSDWADYGCRIGQCIACGQVPRSNEPPQGWFAFGTHVDTPGRLEFSEALGDDGMPKWERPAPGSTVRCPGCDLDPVGYAPHNGRGDCPPIHLIRTEEDQ